MQIIKVFSVIYLFCIKLTAYFPPSYQVKFIQLNRNIFMSNVLFIYIFFQQIKYNLHREYCLPIPSEQVKKNNDWIGKTMFIIGDRFHCEKNKKLIYIFISLFGR